MAGEEEDFGSAKITINLDDGAAQADATALGQRIQRALDRSTRNAGEQIRRNIQRSLDAAAVSVQVEPNIARFQARLNRALRGLTTSVQVDPDLTRFEARLNAGLRGLGSSVTVPVGPDASTFRARLDAALRNLGEFAVQVTVDADRFRARVQRATRQLTVAVRVDPDLARFEARLRAGIRGITAAVRVEPDVSRFAARLRAQLRSVDAVLVQARADAVRFRRELERALRGLPPISIRVDPDLTRLNDALRRHNAPPVIVPLDVDRDRFQHALSGVLGSLSGLGKKAAGIVTGLLKLGAVGIAAAAAAQGVIGLGAALASTFGIVAALPAVILGSVAAVGALKLALSGVGDAFSAALSGDAKAFEKSLEGLSPKAQAAARELRALKPEFDRLKTSVQDAFFGKITGQITATAKALGGPLKSGLSSIAGAWGTAAKNALGYVKGTEGVGNIKSILGAASQAVTGLSDTTNKVTAGFLQLAGVISDKFGGDLESGISRIGQKFGDFLQRIASGGQAVAWVDGALTSLAKFGDIAGNIGSIFSGVFGAASDAGGSFLDRLQTITKSVADFVNSTAGQTALGDIFTVLAQVAAQVGPIIAAVVTQVGNIAPLLLPLVQIGPLLVKIITGLGTAVSGALPNLAVAFGNVQSVVASLLPALPPLATAFAALVRSASDLLVPLAPIVTLLAQFLGPVISLAAPLIVAGVAILGIVKALEIAQGAIIAVRTVWVTLQVAFAASPIGIIVLAVIALGIAIYLLYQRFAIVRTVVDAVGNALKTAFLAAVGFVKDAASKIGSFFVGAFETAKSAVSTGVDAVVTFFTGLPGKISGGLSSLGSTIGTFFTDAFTTVSTAVQTGIAAVINFFTALPGQIAAALLALPGLLVNAFTSAVAFAIIGLLTVIAGIVFIFTELPARIYTALVSLGTFLIAAFTAGFNTVTSTVSSWITATIAFFEALPGQVYSALAALGNFLITAFTAGFNAVTTTVGGWITATVAFFSALPGKILSALSSLGSFLLRNFTAAFNSAKSGISSFISGAVNFFTALPGKIVSTLSALPGKLANAFTSAASSAKKAVGSLISGVVNLFSSLGSKIVSAMGNIGGQIVAKVKAGLPSSVRKYLPFANGGVVYGPTHALIGEAGPEVVIPLTKPKRAQALAARSGLMGILGINQAQGLAAQSSSSGSGKSSSTVNSGVADLSKALSGIAKLLDNVGVNVVQGLVDGITNNTKAVTAAAQAMANTAVVAAEDTLGIASPSKVFKRIGVDTGRGLVVGITGTASQIRAAMQRVANGVIKIGREIGIGFIAGLTGTASQIKSTTSKLANDIAAAFKGVKTNVDDRLITLVQTSNVKLQALAVQRDAIAKQLAAAQKFASDTAATALQTGSLQNLTQGDTAVTTRGLVSGLKAALFQVKQFNNQVAALAKSGLRKDLLSQIIGLGPEQGAQLATSLAGANKATVARINSLQAQLVTASDKLGRTGADALFDSGKAAGEGFLAGIKSQQAAIEKLMITIAKGMQRAIRKALDIRSPSHVFRRIGELTGAGLHVGFLARFAALQAATRTAARGLVSSVASEFSRMPGLAGEMSADNVIPLTRAQRTQQRAQDPAAGGGSTGRGTRGKTDAAPTTVNHNTTVNIHEVGNARATAHRVANRLAVAGMGL